jgi:hypothetical protein
MIEVLDHYCHTEYGTHVWDNLIGQEYGAQVESTLLEKTKYFLDHCGEIDTLWAAQGESQLYQLDKALVIKPFPETENLFLESISHTPAWYFACCTRNLSIIACALKRSDKNDPEHLFDFTSHRLTDPQKWLLNRLGCAYFHVFAT